MGGGEGRTIMGVVALDPALEALTSPNIDSRKAEAGHMFASEASEDRMLASRAGVISQSTMFD